MDMAHLITKKQDHVEYELNCPVCKKKISIKVNKEIARKSQRFPFEYVDIHGNPPHGITLYIDKNWQVRGIEIFKNINLQNAAGAQPQMVRVPRLKVKVNPMAQQLGIISKREYEIIKQIDGDKSIEDIARILKKDYEYVYEIIQELLKKKMVEIYKITR